MKTKAKRIIIASLMVFGALLTHHSMGQSFYSNPLNINPAMGLNEDFKVILDYRNQWQIIDGGYTNYAFTALYPISMGDEEDKLDLGLNVKNNVYGAFKDMQASLALGYELKISETSSLSSSILFGYAQKSLDRAGLIFDDQYVTGNFDPANISSESITDEKITYPDVGFGLMWHSKASRDEANLTAYVGISGYHLNKPRITFTDGNDVLDPRFSFQAGFTAVTGETIDISPNIIYNNQAGTEELLIGSYFDYYINESNKLFLAAWHRKKSNFVFMLGFDALKYFMIGYSYDLNRNQLSTALSGLHTHQITLSYRIKAGDVSIRSF